MSGLPLARTKVFLVCEAIIQHVAVMGQECRSFVFPGSHCGQFEWLCSFQAVALFERETVKAEMCLTGLLAEDGTKKEQDSNVTDLQVKYCIHQ